MNSGHTDEGRFMGCEVSEIKRQLQIQEAFNQENKAKIAELVAYSWAQDENRDKEVTLLIETDYHQQQKIVELQKECILHKHTLSELSLANS
jgi:hypothetical protein